MDGNTEPRAWISISVDAQKTGVCVDLKGSGEELTQCLARGILEVQKLSGLPMPIFLTVLAAGIQILGIETKGGMGGNGAPKNG